MSNAKLTDYVDNRNDVELGGSHQPRSQRLSPKAISGKLSIFFRSMYVLKGIPITYGLATFEFFGPHQIFVLDQIGIMGS